MIRELRGREGARVGRRGFWEIVHTPGKILATALSLRTGSQVGLGEKQSAIKAWVGGGGGRKAPP